MFCYLTIEKNMICFNILRNGLTLTKKKKTFHVEKMLENKIIIKESNL